MVTKEVRIMKDEKFKKKLKHNLDNLIVDEPILRQYLEETENLELIKIVDGAFNKYNRKQKSFSFPDLPHNGELTANKDPSKGLVFVVAMKNNNRYDFNTLNNSLLSFPGISRENNINEFLRDYREEYVPKFRVQSEIRFGNITFKEPAYLVKKIITTHKEFKALKDCNFLKSYSNKSVNNYETTIYRDLTIVFYPDADLARSILSGQINTKYKGSVDFDFYLKYTYLKKTGVNIKQLTNKSIEDLYEQNKPKRNFLQRMKEFPFKSNHLFDYAKKIEEKN